MKPTLIIVALVTTLVLCTPMVSSMPSPATEPLVESICGTSVDQKFCHQVFNNLLNPYADVGFDYLTGLAISESARNATNTFRYITTALLPGQKDPTLWTHYKKCADVYERLEELLETAYQQFTKHSYDNMNKYLSDTPVTLEGCNYIFPLPQSTNDIPLRERNREMGLLLAMCIEAAGRIKSPA